MTKLHTFLATLSLVLSISGCATTEEKPSQTNLAMLTAAVLLINIPPATVLNMF
jgi:hypothetical protein